MKDHAVVGKFIGILPSEKALTWWINTTWKPQGHYDLELGVKGFFTVIFLHREDQNMIFEGNLYFFNAVGIYLRLWKERFNPDKEDLTVAPISIRMYSLPSEYWRDDILEGIGNTLGSFMRASEQTRRKRFTSYA